MRCNREWKLAAIAELLFITSCTVGPKYVKPSVPVPPAYKETGLNGEWKRAEPSDELARGKWWERFNDAELNSLEDRVHLSNQDIVAAAANVTAAHALIRQARAAYFPSVSVNPSVTNSRLATAFGKAVGSTFTTYILPVEASWEPDLWGRVRNTVLSNTSAAQASAADLEDIRLSVEAEVAADYFELRAQDALERLLDATVAAYKSALELTNNLYTSGLANDEAVAQAETQLKTAQAQETNSGVLRAQYEHAIAMLCGQVASSFSIAPGTASLQPPVIPLGIPSDLLERRPDVAAAERAVAQANAQIGIAKTAYYPTITLSASAGFQGVSPDEWIAWPSRIWSLGASLAETVFEAGARRSAVRYSEAEYDQTVASYRQTVLTAFQQVEDNLAALRILEQVTLEQNAAIASARRSLQIADVRYRSGLDPYLNVIVAQTSLLNLQVEAVSFQNQQMVAAVQLIRALGGGWDSSKLPSSAELQKANPASIRAR